jgi:alkanesulfonate monooxygenase SsuD/methylene tetrahydromethanopterin reductase-like flavin-dependent oxidoreductase (luciferase family)
MPASDRILLNGFSMNCVSHIQQGLWVREDTRQLEYTSLDPWVELAQILEKGCFDALFLADVIGVYDTYRGGGEVSISEGMQIPVNDPSLLIPAMAHATEHLGFAYTSSVLQAHPFAFARQISTLDHLTSGRIAWNIVTSYLPNAGASLGFGGLPAHDERITAGDSTNARVRICASPRRSERRCCFRRVPPTRGARSPRNTRSVYSSSAPESCCGALRVSSGTSANGRGTSDAIPTTCAFTKGSPRWSAAPRKRRNANARSISSS